MSTLPLSNREIFIYEEDAAKAGFPLVDTEM